MVRRSGAPWRSFATRTSVRCPTTSRPSRTQPLRRSSRRRPAPSSSAARSGAGVPAGSRTSRSAPARRAKATSRASWSARLGGRGPRRTGSMGAAGVAGVGVVDGSAVAGGAVDGDRAARAVPRSSTRMSTARAWSSVPAIASACPIPSGTSTASHSRLTPRATASTGSRLRDRSIHAARAPTSCAPASARMARVVEPLEPTPESATVPGRGRPLPTSNASSSANPVGIAEPGAAAGRGRGAVASAPPTPASGSG